MREWIWQKIVSRMMLLSWKSNPKNVWMRFGKKDKRTLDEIIGETKKEVSLGKLLFFVDRFFVEW